MNSKVYKWCGVPLCKNTSIKTPNKLFVFVPTKKSIRDKWFQLARRDPSPTLTTNLYFCEDHFDLPNDMENYMQYHLMGSVAQVRMKPGCMPSKFQCQADRKKRTSTEVERPYFVKKQKKWLIKGSDKESEECNTATKRVELREGSSGSSEKNSQDAHKTEDKSTQANIRNKFKSRASQTDLNEMPPLKCCCQSRERLKSASPSISSPQVMIKQEPDIEISYSPPTTHRETSPTISIHIKSEYSEPSEEDEEQEDQKVQLEFNNTTELLSVSKMET